MKDRRVQVTLSKDYPVRMGSITIKKGSKLEVTPDVESALERDGFVENRERKAE